MPEESKPSDFRYSTGESKVPWAAVGENYNADDIVDIIGFLAQKADDEYDAIFKTVSSNVRKLIKHSRPPGKLSLGDNVVKLEGQLDEFLGTQNATFITNATAGFEIGYRYANLKEGDEVIMSSMEHPGGINPWGMKAKRYGIKIKEFSLNLPTRDVDEVISAFKKQITPRTKVLSISHTVYKSGLFAHLK